MRYHLSHENLNDALAYLQLLCNLPDFSSKEPMITRASVPLLRYFSQKKDLSSMIHILQLVSPFRAMTELAHVAETYMLIAGRLLDDKVHNWLEVRKMWISTVTLVKRLRARSEDLLPLSARVPNMTIASVFDANFLEVTANFCQMLVFEWPDGLPDSDPSRFFEELSQVLSCLTFLLESRKTTRNFN